MKFFPDNILLLKNDRFEGFSNQIKTDGMVKNHLSSCNSYIANFMKAHLQFLVTPTRQTINPMALKVFPHTTILLDVCQIKGFFNGIKFESMVSNYFSSCNSEQLIIILKKFGTVTHAATPTGVEERGSRG